MSRRKIVHPDWPPERAAELARLWDTDLSATQIGIRLGVTKSAVMGKVRRMKLRPRRVGTGNRVIHLTREDPREAFDPNRADKLLRRFSWEDAA